MNASSSNLRQEFNVPSWAARPPDGYHLDVMKGKKLLQKLMIDEKGAYFFGRNANSCDFVVDHASCSRVHALLVYHKMLKRQFLIDLGSSHGTFISNTRLEPQKPEPLSFDQPFHFGASTRSYILREKPPTAEFTKTTQDGGVAKEDSVDDLESVTDMERLTEYNTAINRRIADLQPTDQALPTRSRSHRKSVAFNLTEEIINLEDIDPSIGRYRNLVQSSVVVKKKSRRYDVNNGRSVVFAGNSADVKSVHPGEDLLRTSLPPFPSCNSTLRSLTIDSAPDTVSSVPQSSSASRTAGPSRLVAAREDHAISAKKKYPIEAWPGKYSGINAFV